MTRPMSRTRVARPRLKATSPTRISTGAIAATSKVSNCTISVVPTLAPSMTAIAVPSVISPLAMKLCVISPVAVLLCSSAVMPSPASAAFQRLFSPRISTRRKSPPKARRTPEWIMWRPQSIRATNPAIWRRVAVADIAAVFSFDLA